MAVTQSIPQTIWEVDPDPAAFSTFTAHTRAPGATPTTPMSLSRAAAVPATCEPWPLSSSAGAPGETQLVPLRAFRSGWSRSIPVSITAMSTLTSPLPLPDCALDSSPSIRLIPVGSVWALTWKV